MIDDLLKCYDAFEQQGVENPLRETLRLADLALKGLLRTADLASLELDEAGLSRVARMRREGVPLEYILGRAAFMGQLFFCSQDTLIPREETELLARVTLDLIQEMQQTRADLTIVDMGTGSGNIAVSLALYSQNTRVLASDISPAAVEIARENVSQFGLHDRVKLFCGDLFSPFGAEYEEKIDIVVCNPPYIPTDSLDKMAPEIIDHEPVVALDAGAYGLAIFRRLIADAVTVLRPGGILLFEIGAGQDGLVTRLLSRNPAYERIATYDDGVQVRVMSAVKKAAD